MFGKLQIFFALVVLYNFPLFSDHKIELKAMVKECGRMVLATKQVKIPGHPQAYNPSIIQTERGLLLTFRSHPDRNKPWVSTIGYVFLNESADPISEPAFFDTRQFDHRTPSQAEDARLFLCNNKLFVIYNDNIEIQNPSAQQRRDMFLAEVQVNDDGLTLAPAIKLIHEKKYPVQLWQKNWLPFEYNHEPFMIYTVTPHEILHPDLMTGICAAVCETTSTPCWQWGECRGSTPPLLVDGEYLVFFHSMVRIQSDISDDRKIPHYFFGAYTFSAAPPFEITKMTPNPIIAEGFYTRANFHSRVVYPGGYVISGSRIYLAYGRNDQELWIATIDNELLQESLKPLQ